MRTGATAWTCATSCPSSGGPSAPRGGLDGPELDAALRGPGTHPRGGALAGRMLRVLAEVGLVEVDAQAREVLVISSRRMSLDSSPAFRAYAARLAAAEAHLAPAPARVAA